MILLSFRKYAPRPGGVQGALGSSPRIQDYNKKLIELEFDSVLILVIRNF